jgi:hypothetical protein
MARHLKPVSNCGAIASAIGEELRARYQPTNGLSPELRRLLRQISCSSAGNLVGGRSGHTRCGFLTMKHAVWPKFRFGSSATNFDAKCATVGTKDAYQLDSCRRRPHFTTPCSDHRSRAARAIQYLKTIAI